MQRDDEGGREGKEGQEKKKKKKKKKRRKRVKKLFVKPSLTTAHECSSQDFPCHNLHPYSPFFCPFKKMTLFIYQSSALVSTFPLARTVRGHNGFFGSQRGISSSCGFSVCPFHGLFILCGETRIHSPRRGLYLVC